MKRAVLNRRLSCESRESDSFEKEEILDLPYLVSSSRRDTITPSINDVLIVNGPGAFDYIGNRRYRVLIEANFSSYFDQGADDAKRSEIVDGIISSVEGNQPKGRFLVPNKEANCKFNESHECLHSIKWKRATREEAEAKTHFTFLSAGNFLVSQVEQMNGKIEQQVAPASMQDGVENKKQRKATSSVAGVEAALHEMVGATKKQISPSSVHGVTLCPSYMRGVDSKPAQDSSMQDVAAALQEMNKKMEQQIDVDKGGAREMKGDTEKQVDTSLVLGVDVNNNDLEDTSMNSTASTLSQDCSQDLIDLSSTMSSIHCPTRIRDFVKQPIDKYFVLTSPNLNYITPSKYDILCGSGNHFFHHIGNRRFRIQIEMKVHKYQDLMKPCNYSRDDSSIYDLVKATVRSFIGCKPSVRFLGMDMSTGQWRVLNSDFAMLKTEQTFFECMKVMKNRRRTMLQQEAELLSMTAHTAMLYNVPLFPSDVHMGERNKLSAETLPTASGAPCSAHPSFGVAAAMMQTILSKASVLPSGPPRPSSGVAAAMMQTQAMRELCDARNLEKTKLSTEILSKASMLPCNGQPYASAGADMMQTQTIHQICDPKPQNKFCTEKQKTESFLQHMRASKDILDVVGGMLSLGNKSC